MNWPVERKVYSSSHGAPGTYTFWINKHLTYQFRTMTMVGLAFHGEVAIRWAKEPICIKVWASLGNIVACSSTRLLLILGDSCPCMSGVHVCFVFVAF